MKRIKNWELFKESYLGGVNENEESMPAELGTETSDAPAEAPSEEETPAATEETPAGEEAPATEEAPEEENDELKNKIKSVIEENYTESLQDLIKGIVGELEEGEDHDKVIDAILDVLEEKIEEILMAPEEGTEGQDLNIDGSEEAPAAEEAPAEEGAPSEEAPTEEPVEDQPAA